jgi:hypothetical protein
LVDTVKLKALSAPKLASSLRELLSSAYFGNANIKNQIRILDTYWKAIEHLIPEAFAEPSAYTLQKSVGVMVLHPFLIQILELIRSGDGSVLDVSSYQSLLKRSLLKLEGESGSGQVVTGSTFWLSGTRGAAGSFSSNAGKRVLLARLRSKLPDVEVE